MPVISHYELAKLGRFKLYNEDSIGNTSGAGMFRRVVFRETFTGTGSQTVFTLTGNIGNATFIQGSWDPIRVQNTLPADATTAPEGAALYDSTNPFTRHRIYIDSINASNGDVTLNYPPRTDDQFYIWYWYELRQNDVLQDYYREDHVASMEDDVSVGGLIPASFAIVDTSPFIGILGPGDVNVQIALQTIDTHTHNNEFFHEVDCLDTDTVGKVMCIRGNRDDNKWRVETSDPSNYLKMPGLGILVFKYTSTYGIIQFFGQVTSVFSGLTPNARYFVGPNGIVTTAPPISGFVQSIGLAVASDVLFLPGDLGIIRRR